MKKLYIDSNTYISYISPTSDVKSLVKLKRLIIEKKVGLMLPLQTKREFLKHRDNKINEVKNKLKVGATALKVPPALESDKENIWSKDILEIVTKINQVNAKIKELRIKREVAFRNHLKEVNGLIEDLLKMATALEDSDEIILSAIIRHTKGLPPRKEKENVKFGDAIIWETLKSYIRSEELTIVSSDPDFGKKAGKSKSVKVNKVLATEWRRHTKNDLILYPLLGHFVDSVEKGNPVGRETIKNEAAQAVFSTESVLAPNQFLSYNPNESFAGQIITSVENPFLLGTAPASFTLPTTNTPIVLSSNKVFQNGWPYDGLGYAVSTNSLRHDDSAVLYNVTTSGAVVGTLHTPSTCSRCRKTYFKDATKVTVTNLCKDCSGYLIL